MVYLIIAILIVTVIVLAVKLILLKIEMKKTSVRLSKDDCRTLSVDSVDKDLDSLILEINKMFERTLEIRNNASLNEKTLRNSISMISHDMKTPLTSVIGYLQLALKTEGPESSRNINIALERALYLNDLVNDFFDVSLIDSDRYAISPESLNICELICEEVFALSPNFDKRGIIPVFENSDDNVTITTDRKMITRIVQNILSNCIKYSESKTIITVVKKGGQVTISVSSDSKREIDTEKIFDKFYREDEARSGNGAGLGMYICKRFSSALKGEINARQDSDILTIELILPYNIDNR